MKKLIIIMSVLLSTNALADPASEIKQAIENNLKHTQQEDIEKVIDSMHSKSPGYLATHRAIQQLFPTYDFKYQLLEYHFIALDGEYAYARVRQRTEKVYGPEFKNNDIEALQVFKKENGRWKIWTQSNLNIIYL